MKRIFVSFCMLFLVSALCFAASKADRQSKVRQVREKIESRDYLIDVNRALPQRWGSISLTSRYSVAIKGDSLRCYLPYYGRAYTLPYGGGEGLVFDAVMTNYKFSIGKRDQANISFNVRTAEDGYRFLIDIFPEGSVSLTVQPNNKQSISFTGEMNLDDKK